MHEFSVAQSLVETVTAEARRAGAVRVSQVRCRVGSLTHIDSSILTEAFAMVADGGMCAGAELVVERAEMTVNCPRCHKQFPVRHWEWHCPHCGAEGIDPYGGDEIVLLSIEAEVPDEDRSAQKRVRQE